MERYTWRDERKRKHLQKKKSHKRKSERGDENGEDERDRKRRRKSLNDGKDKEVEESTIKKRKMF